MAELLALALDELDVPVLNRTTIPKGSRNGADWTAATVVQDGRVWDVDPLTVAAGLHALYTDRLEHGGATRLERVATAWRDRMLQARAISSCAELTGSDAVRILRLGLDTAAHAQ